MLATRSESLPPSERQRGQGQAETEGGGILGVGGILAPFGHRWDWNAGSLETCGGDRSHPSRRATLNFVRFQPGACVRFVCDLLRPSIYSHTHVTPRPMDNTACTFRPHRTSATGEMRGHTTRTRACGSWTSAWNGTGRIRVLAAETSHRTCGWQTSILLEHEGDVRLGCDVQRTRVRPSFLRRACVCTWWYFSCASKPRVVHDVSSRTLCVDASASFTCRETFHLVARAHSCTSSTRAACTSTSRETTIESTTYEPRMHSTTHPTNPRRRIERRWTRARRREASRATCQADVDAAGSVRTCEGSAGRGRARKVETWTRRRKDAHGRKPW